MQVILFDDQQRKYFYPLELGRPLAKLFFGCYTMEERWQVYWKEDIDFQYLTEDYLEESITNNKQEYLYINARLIASEDLVNAIKSTPSNNSYFDGENLLWTISEQVFNHTEELIQFAKNQNIQNFDKDFQMIRFAWDLFSMNEQMIAEDIKTLPKTYLEHGDLQGVFINQPERIYIHPDAKIMPCFLEAQNGYIYIGAHAKINMGAMVQGSLVMRENAELKLGAKVYGATSLGKYVKIGGEVSNVVFFDYSNKGHEGFVGNSVIGSWCNFGADTNSSNLKNNYSMIKVWNPYLNENIDTGLQFLGVLMGDHCKLGINTMLNTATVVGCHSNIFGAGFPRKNIPSFYWGGADEEQKHDYDKAMITAERMMNRRSKSLSDQERNIYHYIFKQNNI